MTIAVRNLLAQALALAFMLMLLVVAFPAHADESAALFFVREHERAAQPRAHPSHVVHGGRLHRHRLRAVPTPPPRSLLGAMVTRSAIAHGVPVRVAHAIVKVESNYSCRARSWANARGVMQVLPATARSVGVHGSLYDCRTGVEAGMRYLKKIIAAHGVSCAALGLYERGLYARPRCTAYGARAMRFARL